MSYGFALVTIVWGTVFLLLDIYFWLKWRTEELLEELMEAEEG